MGTYTPDSNKIVHNVDVDFKRREIVKPIHLVQYDDSLPILAVSLYSDGQTYTIPDSAYISIRVGKSDRTFVYNKSLGYNQAKNIAYFEITQQMTALNGDVKAVIEVNDNGNVACSSYIIFAIDRNPVQEDMVESTDEFTTIVEMKDIAVKSANEAKKSESNAKESETNAAKSANEAKKSESNAKESENNAATSESNAAKSENAAKESENKAKESETNAKLSETNAATSAEIAASYNGARYSVCSNARTDINKVVTVEDFELKAGAHVFVKFTDTGVTNPDSGNFTLNVNGTGDIPIYYSGPNYAEVPYTSAYFFSDNRCEEFLYDGERWLWVNYGYNSDTKNTAGASNKTGTKMFLVGATAQNNGITSYSNSGCYIGSDNELYSNGTKVLTSKEAGDTKNTAGTTNKADTKLFLAGATEQSDNPVTYSNSGCYIGTDNELYSNDKKVAAISDLVNLVYPVGSIYMSVNNVNPATLFGGTWVRWGNGRVPVGVDEQQGLAFGSVENTGGSIQQQITTRGTVGNTTLTINQMPSHSHKLLTQAGNYLALQWETAGLVRAGEVNYTLTNEAFTSANGEGQPHTHSFTGSNHGFSILQPYITCYMWKRTS